MLFCTIDDVETLRGTSLSVEEAAQCTALIEAATALIRAETKSYITESEQVFNVHSRIGLKSIRIPSPLARAIVAIEIDGEVADPTTYWLENGMLFFVDTVSFTRMTVSFLAGTTRVPTVVNLLCASLVLEGLSQLTATGKLSTGNIQSERIDDYSVSYFQNAAVAVSMLSIPRHIVEMLRSNYGTNYAAI